MRAPARQSGHGHCRRAGDQARCAETGGGHLAMPEQPGRLRDLIVRHLD
ncbi:hypothetical protein AB4Z48_02595 [Cupriavidus sp. 2TAF22]